MRTQNDYSFIRGFNYMWFAAPENWEKELGYAKRLNLNSARIWLDAENYKNSPEEYIERLKRFVRTANSNGISTMPILWNGNFFDLKILDKAGWSETDAYVKAIVNGVKGEDGLLMWDIMNEPSCNDYIKQAPSEAEKAERMETIWAFVRHNCEVVKSTDTVNAITVGNTYIWETKPTADIVDVISFHDYSERRSLSEKVYKEATEYAAQYGKPVINSEMACLCRANPYEVAIKTAEQYHVGWYVFELMIHDYWGDVHGIFYPDGTIRDPSIVAAIMGFYRNRSETVIRPNPNKEGYVNMALKMANEALDENAEVFKAKPRTAEKLLEAAEFCANLLEGCEMVPMIDSPITKILQWRKQGYSNITEISALTYQLALTLKQYNQILTL